MKRSSPTARLASGNPPGMYRTPVPTILGWVVCTVLPTSSARRDPRLTAPWPEEVPVAIQVPGQVPSVRSSGYQLCVPEPLWVQNRAIVLATYISTPGSEATMLTAVLVFAALRRAGYTLSDIAAVCELSPSHEVEVAVLAGFLHPLSVDGLRSSVVASPATKDLYEDALRKPLRR